MTGGPERIWITGMGAVSPAGWTVTDLWSAVIEGRSCVGDLKRFPTHGVATRAVGAVPGVESELPDDPLALRFGMAAAIDAVQQAQLRDGDRIDSVVVGNHGERRLPVDGVDGTILKGPDLGDALQSIVGAPTGTSIYGACAGGSLAIGVGMQLLRSGRATRALVGGADSLLREFDFFHFSGLYAMTTRECPPQEASCPFDLRRDGFVLAEGAGFLVIETESAGRARGAEPLAVLEGFGSAQNAYHIVASPPDALGPEASMRAALRDARRPVEDLAYINAHGTSTRDNDWCETLAARQALGSHADRVPMSSSKSVLGHSMAAAGALEAIISVLVLRENVLPPTINLHEPDPRCDLDYVANEARESRCDLVASNSFGFGGHSSTLVLGKP